jgi:hypothetical protein
MFRLERMANPVPPSSDTVREALAEAKSAAQDQLMAAWQLQLDRIEEQLKGAWAGQIEHIFDERLTELAARMEAHYRGAFETQLNTATAEVTGRLNQAVRRLRRFESAEQWSRALLDAAEGFCRKAALVAIEGQMLEPKTEGVEAVQLIAAPAFASVVETKDTVVAMRTAGELSAPLARWLGESAGEKCYLFPIIAGERVAAVLYADSPDIAALEMIANVAAAALEAHNAAATNSGSLVNIGPAQPPAARTAASWSSLTRQEQDLHLRAQRFARVRVAEMRLYQSHAVKKGRAERNLYASLNQEIDAGREAFRRDFLESSDTMVDYFHLELLRTLANDDIDLLGPDYPGPMV